ncbi:MAG: response regulator [Deltaproteobacteria bacterium]|nr:response regulator [Deltaproteobacteria bacterium]
MESSSTIKLGEPQPVRVLLVDDDVTWTTIVRHLLRKARPGSELHWAGDVAEAGTLLQSGGFDCCLLDYRLGAQSGLDVLRHLPPEARRVPVVLLSGMDDPLLAEQASQLGVVACLSKDAVSPATLERVLRAAALRRLP